MCQCCAKDFYVRFNIMKIKWTNKAISKEAKKYKSKSEWQYNSKASYNAAYNKSLLSYFSKHMKKPDMTRKWTKEVVINNKNLPDFLGVPKFKSGELELNDRVGIVTGLAWTEYGGEILKIETVTMPGKGRTQITGKLGDVCKSPLKLLNLL